jgi:hypothetical protein
MASSQTGRAHNPALVNVAGAIQLALGAASLIAAYGGRALISRLGGAAEATPYAVVASLAVLAAATIAVGLGTLLRRHWARLLGVGLHIHGVMAGAYAAVSFIRTGLEQAGSSMERTVVVATAIIPTLIVVGLPALLLVFYSNPRSTATFDAGRFLTSTPASNAALALDLTWMTAVVATVTVAAALSPAYEGIATGGRILVIAVASIAAWLLLGKRRAGGPAAAAAVAVHWALRFAGVLAAPTGLLPWLILILQVGLVAWVFGAASRR